MIPKINPDPEKIFRNKNAISFYQFMIANDHIWQHGIDEDGNIFFNYHSGNVDRYTRKQFLKYTKNF